MRMAIQRDRAIRLRAMYHVIHLSEDVHAINDWYERVFDADVWMGRVDPHWSEIEADRRVALRQ